MLEGDAIGAALVNLHPATDELTKFDALPNSLCGAVTYSRGLITGWVKRLDSDEALEIVVSVDDVRVWAGRARRKVPTGHGPDGRFAFMVLLPDPSGNGTITNRTVRVQLTDGTDVPGSPLQASYGDHILGYVEAIRFDAGSVLVYGWSIDIRWPAARVNIIGRYDGQIVCESETDQSRPDLSATGYDAPTGGFILTIPCVPDFNHELLAVYAGRLAFPLPRTDNIYLPHHYLGKEEEDAPAIAYGQDEDLIEGTIDHADERVLRGWARNMTSPGATVLLDLFVDGRIYSTVPANRFRPDLAKHFKDHGFHEYRFELAPGATRCLPGKIQVAPRIGKASIKHKIEALPQAIKPSRIIAPRSPDVMLSYRWPDLLTHTISQTVALIVINQNGAALLENLFQSFYQQNTYPYFEFLVVDHGSADHSEAVATRWASELNVVWLPRDCNFSFSASNNYAAAHTDASLLVFINNDITFTSDILQESLRYLNDPTIGCVGVKLLDDCPVGRGDGQIAIQHLGVHFDDGNTGLPILPFETRSSPTVRCVEQAALEVPAVTGAFMAVRRKEFLTLGGFSELYFYGQEDVDLCLKYATSGQKVVSVNNVHALHLRGFSRLKMDSRYAEARARNINLLESRFGAWLQRRLYRDRFTRPGFWTSMIPRIAFVVTEATSDTLAGDYFTALELASQLSARFACATAFVEVGAGNQYDLADFDVVIAMRDDYDPRRIKRAPPHLLKIAWLRNWFERFADRDSSKLFDLVWASSLAACTYLEERLHRRVELIPIATNWYRFRAGATDATLSSDYCFTGSYWGLNREIVQMLDPAALPFNFALFGKGWEKVTHLAPYARGALPYARMPDVYASTRLVIDDANHATKSWGAVNSRVFDAIAGGALVVTNGRSGANTLFDGVLPSFDTPQALEDLLWQYLGDEALRKQKVAELQTIVRTCHTYQLRAQTVWRAFARTSATQLRIALKIGAPSETVKHEWGDYHFATSMKTEFDKLGHTTRIDCLEDWKNYAAVGDHVVIVLRGLSVYQPRPHQINLMWNISHPDKISEYEYDQYNHIFVASEVQAQRLKNVLGDRVSVLLQCTDPRFFNPGRKDTSDRHGLLFVGNSRGELRTIVRDAIAADLPVEVYGSGWHGLIPGKYIKGSNIANLELGRYYATAAVVLNDHWDNMRRAGFISNRIFDVLACGGRLISDRVPGVQETFGDFVETYEGVDELKQTYDRLIKAKVQGAERVSFAAEIGRSHSFAARVGVIMGVIDGLRALKGA